MLKYETPKLRDGYVRLRAVHFSQNKNTASFRNMLVKPNLHIKKVSKVLGKKR